MIERSFLLLGQDVAPQPLVFIVLPPPPPPPPLLVPATAPPAPADDVPPEVPLPELPAIGFDEPPLPAGVPPVEGEPLEGEPLIEVLPEEAPAAAPPVPVDAPVPELPPVPPSVGASEHARVQTPEKMPTNKKGVAYADIVIFAAPGRSRARADAGKPCSFDCVPLRADTITLLLIAID
jgi:hypothetical protein